MKLYSTNKKAEPVTIREAVLNGLAPDGGLWMFPSFDENTADQLNKNSTLQDTAYVFTQSFLKDEVPDVAIHILVEDVFSFPIPLVPVDDARYVLELFHGPTLAFKDIGARFMARLVAHFLAQESKKITVLVATSGDTGAAVAHAFADLEHVHVVLLYPKGKVSTVQEHMLTTAGAKVTALRVHGTFDDCQKMVKQAFVDADITSKHHLLSANSINIARLMAQSIYYAWAWVQMPDASPVSFSVPCGNFGNLTGGLFAQRMGIPVHRFIATCNANHPVVDYLESGNFTPRATVSTLSSAMDIGNPSNFVRMQELFHHDHQAIVKSIIGIHVTDEQTKEEMQKLYREHAYIADPHTAVALRGASICKESPVIALATAHPAKFLSDVQEIVGVDVDKPEQYVQLADRTSKYKDIEPIYTALREVLLHQ